MTRFAVITRVPDDGDSGNLSTAIGDLWVDPQISGGAFTDPRIRLGEAIGNMGIEVFVQVPVFRLGEILVVDGDGREVGGLARKPAKWDVDCAYFDTVEEAVAAAVAVAPR